LLAAACANGGGTPNAELSPMEEDGGSAAVVDASATGRSDAGPPPSTVPPAPPSDGGRKDPDTGAKDAGPIPCPVRALSRTVGTHRAALPAIVWSGTGYTMVIDEIVSEQPFRVALTMEKADATGARVAGPVPITPSDGVDRVWPR